MVRKRFAFVAALVALLVLLWATGGVVAGPPAEGPGGEVNIAGTVASKISYQGRLTDPAGNPLDGTYTMQFQLYDAQSGGTMLWDSGAQSVQVTNGLFNVELDVDPLDFNGQELWLEVRVGGETLAPRQEILPVPYALSLRPGADIRGNIAGASVLYAVNTNSAPYSKGVYGHVTATSGTTCGVYGLAQSPDGYGGYFKNTASGGVGLYTRAKDDWDADLVLGGTSDTHDNGCITSDPAYSSSDIVLVSNDTVRIDLDNDGDGEDADFEIRDKDNNLIFNVDESGDVKQNLAGNGLVKAAVYAKCHNTGSTIHRSFNNVGGTITITNGPSAGQCIIDFGFNISDRFWVATAVHHEARIVNCEQGAGKTKLNCYRFEDDGTGIGGNIMVLVY